jgi:hypothetical protein
MAGDNGPTWVVAISAAAALIGAVATLLGVLHSSGSGPTPDPPGTTPTPKTAPPVANDGSDGANPVLPGTDSEFVDTRAGAGWGDKCWLNIKANKWGWAKAECDRAIAMNPPSHEIRAMLLYNEGLIDRHLGRNDTARAFFVDSIALRPNATVQEALDSLGH